jgi:hypothetical protein
VETLKLLTELSKPKAEHIGLSPIAGPDTSSVDISPVNPVVTDLFGLDIVPRTGHRSALLLGIFDVPQMPLITSVSQGYVPLVLALPVSSNQISCLGNARGLHL